VVLRTRPDLVEGWSDEETTERWLTLFPMERDEGGKPKTPSGSAIEFLAGQADRFAEIRFRLGSVSWFMRCLNEYGARMASREDGCKGRFWEGRFKCQALLDESALLACMAHVELNPIRTGVAETPEGIQYTGIYERNQARSAGRHETWLCPLGEEDHGCAGACCLSNWTNICLYSTRQAGEFDWASGGRFQRIRRILYTAFRLTNPAGLIP